jgi:hypothetical protein
VKNAAWTPLHKEFMEAATKLLGYCEENDITDLQHYPEYMPAFEEFVADFAKVHPMSEEERLILRLDAIGVKGAHVHDASGVIYISPRGARGKDEERHAFDDAPGYYLLLDYDSEWRLCIYKSDGSWDEKCMMLRNPAPYDRVDLAAEWVNDFIEFLDTV